MKTVQHYWNKTKKIIRFIKNPSGNGNLSPLNNEPGQRKGTKHVTKWRQTAGK